MACKSASNLCIFQLVMNVLIIVMASARSSSSLVTNAECFNLSDSTQYCTEVNIPPATSEIVIVVQKMIVDDNQTELVIGKEQFIPQSMESHCGQKSNFVYVYTK